MKRVIFTVFSIAVFQTIYAQEAESRGAYLLGGSFSFLTQKNTYPISLLNLNAGIGGNYSYSTNDTKTTTFAITPYFGKEINPKLFVGAELEYRLSKYRAEDLPVFGQPDLIDYERKSNQIGVGIFTRHILNPNSQFNFFIQPLLGYHLLNEDSYENSMVYQEEIVKYFEASVGLGLMHNFNEKIRATVRTGGLNYINGNWKVKNGGLNRDFSSFGTNLSLSSIYIGVEFRI